MINLIVIGLIVAGTAFRLAVVLLGAPPTNSDEAIMGLTACLFPSRWFPVLVVGLLAVGSTGC
ncbi:hypothetical protein ACN27F_09075 [Solwaraspora sp. WMMB335]|uniref:hypothetical protein n=1 Tax=Solwaraspora sp. WMMB335 TaxID=3404118 RepID=UPI003B934114